MDTYIELRQRFRDNVHALKSLRHMSDGAIAELAGFASRQTVANRTRGNVIPDILDLVRFGVALRVDPLVLLLPPTEAMAWAVEHQDYVPPDLPALANTGDHRRSAAAKTAAKRAQAAVTTSSPRRRRATHSSVPSKS